MLNAFVAARVTDIKYRFDKDSRLHTSILIDQGVETPYGILNEFRTELIRNRDNVRVSPGDIVRFIIDNAGVVVEVLERASDQPAPIRPSTCPFCGSPMLYKDRHDVSGYCFNRSCLAQLSHNIMRFASALDRPLEGRYFQIADMLLSRGVLRSPADLFNVPLEDLLILPGVSEYDARNFQTYIHSVRGSVRMEQLLRGLSVPNWGALEYRLVESLSDVTRDHIYTVLNPLRFRELGICKYSSWQAFISIPSNRKLVCELIDILSE